MNLHTIVQHNVTLPKDTLSISFGRQPHEASDNRNQNHRTNAHNNLLTTNCNGFSYWHPALQAL
jgi:hypothetical protein